MQPYFLPYVGYFQLINYCDIFVVYDDIQYSKRGWINRNRLQTKNGVRTFTLPLRGDSDYLDIRDRTIAENYEPKSLASLFSQAFSRSSNWSVCQPLLEDIFFYKSRNLFEFVFHSIQELCRFMGISTPLIASSQLNISRSLRAQERIVATCKALEASTYINPIGGTQLYEKATFRQVGLKLLFLESSFPSYDQLGDAHVPNLTVIDPLAFLPRERFQTSLASDFKLVEE